MLVPAPHGSSGTWGPGSCGVSPSSVMFPADLVAFAPSHRPCPHATGPHSKQPRLELVWEQRAGGPLAGRGSPSSTSLSPRVPQMPSTHCPRSR